MNKIEYIAFTFTIDLDTKKKILMLYLKTKFCFHL
jgi:hypothetical protein